MGKIAIVTGAGSGIGRAVARTLLKAGYSVALAGPAQGAARGDGGGRAATRSSFRPTSRKSGVRRCALFKATKDKFGRLDLLFNNAGTNTPAVPFEELTDEQWQGVVDVNLNGMFYLRARGGAA